MVAKRSIRCASLLVALSVVIATARAATACPKTLGPFCPCAWEKTVIPVWAKTLDLPGQAYLPLQTLSPTRSAAEWERIITNALNIYREHSGMSVRLRFAGHTSADSNAGAIVIMASPASVCDDSLGYGSFSVNYLDWNEISSARIQLRNRVVGSAGCEVINWDPRLLQDYFAPPNNKDPVNLLVHELGHTLGLAHPDTDCNDPRGAVMHSGYQNWNRHLTRDDKDSLWQLYPRQDPIGKTFNYTAGGSWAYQGDWPTTNGKIWPRPFTVTSDRNRTIVAYGDWYQSSTGHPRIKAARNTIANSWVGPVNTLWDSWNSPSAVYAGAGRARIYFFYDPQPWFGEQFRKQLCYVETSNGGNTWNAMVCPDRPGGAVNEKIVTRRDGIAVAFDWHTRNYIVLYNADNSLSCYPYCNQITGITMPGPGSSLPTSVAWVVSGHHSFSAPSVACRPSSASADRCIIAFSASELYPYLRWVEGAPSSVGLWTQTADRHQVGIPLDQSPSVVWSNFDGRFHLATHQRVQQYSRLDTYYKGNVGGAGWTWHWGEIHSTNSTSAPILGTTPQGIRMYYFRYRE